MKKKIASLLFTALLAVSVIGCSVPGSGSKVVTPDENGYAEGKLGDTMRNSFFDYTVNSAYLCDTYSDYTPQSGYELLVADVTVKNVFGETITMFDNDFQVQWNSDANDAYDCPVTYYLAEGTSLGDEVLPGEYDLAKDESRTGLLVFEVPAGEKEFSISYMEYFEDDSTGDTFFVFFSAGKAASFLIRTAPSGTCTECETRFFTLRKSTPHREVTSQKIPGTCPRHISYPLPRPFPLRNAWPAGAGRYPRWIRIHGTWKYSPMWNRLRYQNGLHKPGRVLPPPGRAF